MLDWRYPLECQPVTRSASGKKKPLPFDTWSTEQIQLTYVKPYDYIEQYVADEHVAKFKMFLGQVWAGDGLLPIPLQNCIDAHRFALKTIEENSINDTDELAKDIGLPRPKDLREPALDTDDAVAPFPDSQRNLVRSCVTGNWVPRNLCFRTMSGDWVPYRNENWKSIYESTYGVGCMDHMAPNGQLDFSRVNEPYRAGPSPQALAQAMEAQERRRQESELNNPNLLEIYSRNGHEVERWKISKGA